MTTADPIRPSSISSPIMRPMRGSRIDVFYGTGAYATSTASAREKEASETQLPSLSSLDSAFQLQEYISLVIRKDVHDVDRIISIPSIPGKEDGKGVDENCWIYEQLRRLAQDLTHPLITALQVECTRQTCPEMKAGEWLYLCVAHGNESTSHSSSSSENGSGGPGGGMMMEQCCAIDYILHTIDSATALLNSPRAFPSRLSIPVPSVRHFSSLARRLGRVFAHAYFHHRDLFEQAEAESSLYRRFEEMVGRWGLVPREFLVIPSLGKENDLSKLDDDSRKREEPRLEAAAVNFDDHLGFEDDEDGHFNDKVKPVSILLDNSAVGTGPTVTRITPPLEAGAGGDFSRSKSSSPGNTSGKKFGRNRTGTMVFSEASALVDELSKSPGGRAQVELAEASAQLANSQSTSAGESKTSVAVAPTESSKSSEIAELPTSSESQNTATSSEPSSESSQSHSPSPPFETDSSLPKEVENDPPHEATVPAPEEQEVMTQAVEAESPEESQEKSTSIAREVLEVTPSSTTVPSDTALEDVKHEVEDEVAVVGQDVVDDAEQVKHAEQEEGDGKDAAVPLSNDMVEKDAGEGEEVATETSAEEETKEEAEEKESEADAQETQENEDNEVKTSSEETPARSSHESASPTSESTESSESPQSSEPTEEPVQEPVEEDVESKKIEEASTGEIATTAPEAEATVTGSAETGNITEGESDRTEVSEKEEPETVTEKAEVAKVENDNESKDA
ncbi:mps one binder kinase activator-like 4 [Lentinula edodes]|nr:mps one binder kinase activator-like 4 [Lentinula edodes]